MSRHTVVDNDGQTYVYGFDRPTNQYFLDHVKASSDPDEDGVYQPIVGFNAPDPLWRRGTAADMMNAMGQREILSLIPFTHAYAISMDLPIPEKKGTA